MVKKCTFTVKPDQLAFYAKINGDRIVCKGMHVDKENSSDLAYMIQDGKNLKVTIKEVD